MAWTQSRRDNNRNAFIESVASVRGKKIRICNAVDKLVKMNNGDYRAENSYYRAKLDKVVQRNHAMAPIHDVGRSAVCVSEDKLNRDGYYWQPHRPCVTPITNISITLQSRENDMKYTIGPLSRFLWCKKAFACSKIRMSIECGWIGWLHIILVNDGDLQEVHLARDDNHGVGSDFHPIS